jgi:enoyl-CoA hydratase
LALACDFLIGDPTTKFQDTHVKFGLAPCWGLSQRLQRWIGPSRAKYVSLSATAISSQQALEWGLLNEVVPNALDRAIDIANEISANDTTMVRRYRRAIVEGEEMNLGYALKWERSLGMGHYVQMMKDNTLQKAKEYITNQERPRSKM